MNTTSASTATAPLPSPDEHEPHEQSPSAKKLKCDGSGTLQCCPLARDAKVFILHALRNHVTTASKNQHEGKHDSNPVDYLSDLWLQDRDIANLALEANLICADELPAVLRNDRTYILEAVCKNPHIWISLPKPMQADPEFMASIPIFPDLLLLHDVFNQYPGMVHHRGIWMHALDTVLGPDTGSEENREIYRQLLHHFAPDAIRNDQEIMRRSKFVPQIYSYFGSELVHDKEFLQSIYNVSTTTTASSAEAASAKEEVEFSNV